MADAAMVRTGTPRALVVFVVLAAPLATWAVVRFQDETGAAVVVGPLVGLTAAFVMLSPPRWQAAYLAITFAATLAAGVAISGIGLLSFAGVTAAATTAEAAILGLIATRWWPMATRLERRVGVVQFFAATAFATASVQLAAAGALLAVPTPERMPPMPWALGALSDVTAIAVIAPLVISLPALRRLDRRQAVELAAALVVVFITTAVAFDSPGGQHYLRPYVTLTVVVFATAWLGMAAAATLPVVVVSTASSFTLTGFGPFWQPIAERDAALAALGVYTLVVLVGGWLVAALVSERAAAADERDHELEQLVEARVLLEGERNRSVLAQQMAQLGSWELDRATWTTAWSPEVFRIAGIDPPADPVIDLDVALGRIHPDDRQRMVAYIGAVLAGVTGPVAHLRLVRPDDEVRWTETRATRIGPDRCVGFVQDITERRLREDLLRVQAEVLDNMAQGVAVIQAAESALVYSNPRFAHDFGYRGGDAFEPDAEVVRRPEPGSGWTTLGDLTAGSGAWTADVESRRRDGGEFTAKLTVMPMVLTEHGPVAVLLETDVTERRRQERALRESEQRLRLTQEHAPIGMGTVDLDGRWLQVNNALCAMLGRRRAELLTMTVFDLTHPDDVAADRELGRRLRAGELAGGQREKRYLWPDGEIRWAQVNLSLLRGSDGAPRFFIVQVVDITDRRLDEERLRRTAEELREASQAKTQFLSRMSHELRTPLNAVLGYAQLLDLSARGEDHESVTQILRAGRHLLGLIDELLDITSVEAGALRLTVEPVPLRPLITEAVQLTQPFAADHNVTITIADDGSLYAVARADQQRTTQILLNLLSNAIKYNHPGGRVTVAARAAADQVTISVSDTGPGIPADSLDRLFLPFDRLGAEERGIQGTGIGLPLARTLAEGMDGTLQVSSDPGRGSTFVLTLPTAADPGTGVTDGGVSVAAPPPPGRAITVLNIEDNPVNQQLVTAILRQRPAVSLVTAASGAEGLAAVRRNRPDLVLLDLHLPDMSGLDILRTLALGGEGSGPTVAVLSADAHLDQINAALALGATDYLTKPIDLYSLLGLVDSVAAGIRRP